MNVVVLSRGERQAKEFIEESVAPHVRAIGVAAEYLQTPLPQSSIWTQEVVFGNGSRIIALPANPATARSYEGDVVLDEFAFHLDARKIYEAIGPSITRGFSLAIISTPNGQQGAYYEIANEAGLVDARRASERWSPHKTTIEQAVAQGCQDRFGDPLDLSVIRASCIDEEMWLQEYCCAFLSIASQWISPELFDANVSPDATAEYPNPDLRDLYLGWDVARNKDLSVVWVTQLVGDVSWTRGILEFRNTPTPKQTDEAVALMRRARRMCIDKTGMGLSIFETLETKFGSLVEGIQFTLATKESMAVHAKRRMEEVKCRIPDTDMIRSSFRSVKKTTTALGQARFDAEHDSKYGHADHWWSFCLAEAAAAQQTTGLFDLWKEQAEQLRQPKRPRELGTPEEEKQRQSEAQMAEARKSSGPVSRVFGENRGMITKVGISTMTKPLAVEQTPKCPQCQSVAITRCAVQGVSGDLEERCGSCGWSRIVARK